MLYNYIRDDLELLHLKTMEPGALHGLAQQDSADQSRVFMHARHSAKRHPIPDYKVLTGDILGCQKASGGKRFKWKMRK